MEISLQTIHCLCCELQARLAELDLSTDDVNNSLNSLDDMILKFILYAAQSKQKLFLISNIQNPGLTGIYFIMLEKSKPIIYYFCKIKSIVTFILIIETLLPTKLEPQKNNISNINLFNSKTIRKKRGKLLKI